MLFIVDDCKPLSCLHRHCYSSASTNVDSAAGQSDSIILIWMQHRSRIKMMEGLGFALRSLISNWVDLGMYVASVDKLDKSMNS